MPENRDGEKAEEAARAPHEAAGELVRMGIAPSAVGLQPDRPWAPAAESPAAESPGAPAPGQGPPRSVGRAALPATRWEWWEADSAPSVSPSATPSPPTGSGPNTSARGFAKVARHPATPPPPTKPPAPPRGPTATATAPVPPPPVPPPPAPPPPGRGPVAPPPEATVRLTPDQLRAAQVGRAGPGRAGSLARPLDPGAGPAPGPAEDGHRVPFGDVDAPGSWRRVLRAVTFGVLEPGAAAAMERERLLMSHMRTRQHGPRTVAFVAGKGGAGTTTAAIGVTLTLATVRNEKALLVDARAGTGSVGRRVADHQAPTVAWLAAEHGRVPPVAHRGVHLVDAPSWDSPVAAPVLTQVVEELRGDFPFTAVDVGIDTTPPARAALALSDQIVVVTPATADAVDATRTILGKVQQVEPRQAATAIVALVCLPGRGHLHAVQALCAELGLAEGRIVPVPFDRALVGGDRFDPERLRASTREAYLRLAALVAQPVFAQLGQVR